MRSSQLCVYFIQDAIFLLLMINSQITKILGKLKRSCSFYLGNLRIRVCNCNAVVI